MDPHNISLDTTNANGTDVKMHTEIQPEQIPGGEEVSQPSATLSSLTLETSTTQSHHRAPETTKLPSSTVSERLQLIDERQHFNHDMTKYLEKWGLQHVGFDYDLCAVVGSQSTGKSTLLNKLFGTSFDVMKENERRQTTKGL